MSEAPDKQEVSAQQTPQSRPRRRFLTGVLTGGFLGSVLAGGVGLYAQAHPGADHWFRGSYRLGGCLQHAAHDTATMGARIECMADWLLSYIEASDAQRQQVQTVLQATVHDLDKVREQHRLNQQRLLQALAQPTVDRVTLEELRRAGLQLAETASERLVTTLADTAEVLTPEQRARLVAFAARWHH